VLGERLLPYLIWEGNAGELTIVFWVNLQKWFQTAEACRVPMRIASQA
jgi:hypothetical protein